VSTGTPSISDKSVIVNSRSSSLVTSLLQFWQGEWVREAADDRELLSTSRILKADRTCLAVADISGSTFGL
jgi:hypothetical protein